MKIVVSTHQGNLYDEEVEYIVVKNRDGEFAIMKDHVAVVCVIDEGYVKMVRDENQFYVVVCNGMLEYHDNVVSILAQEAHIGKNIDSAKAHLMDIRNERLQLNRQETTDFTQKEKELSEYMRKAKAGSL